MAQIVDDRTPLRGLLLPARTNDLKDDVARLRATLLMLDADISQALQQAGVAQDVAQGVEAALSDVAEAVEVNRLLALGSARTLAVGSGDSSPGTLDAKLSVASGGALLREIRSMDMLLSIRAASTSQTGVVRFATPEEAAARSATDLAVTPSALGNVVAQASRIARSARGSNTALAVGDLGSLVDFTTGGWTQTFAAISTLGAGWFAYLLNSSTGEITLDPAGTEQIDGRSSYVMYPSEARLVVCDGVALRSLVLQPFRKLFSSSGAFSKPPGYVAFDIEAQGGAGGGTGGGSWKANATSIYGGAGGGGGAKRRARLPAASVADLTAVTVGSGGLGGAGATYGGSQTGSSGGNGSVTSFGDQVIAPGGLGGQGTRGGDGGAAINGRANGQADPYAGGGPAVADGYQAYMPVFGGGGGASSGDAGYGSVGGLRSAEGGPGGGAGGGLLCGTGGSFPANAASNGTNPASGTEGGCAVTTGFSVGGGGAAGARSVTASAQASSGGNGSAADDTTTGTAGGGGGAGGIGGNGGNGGRGAGGGGGGASFSAAGGAGGNGGAGALQIIGVT